MTTPMYFYIYINTHPLLKHLAEMALSFAINSPVTKEGYSSSNIFGMERFSMFVQFDKDYLTEIKGPSRNKKKELNSELVKQLK